jgi:hypothetical protein
MGRRPTLPACRLALCVLLLGADLVGRRRRLLPSQLLPSRSNRLRQPSPVQMVERRELLEVGLAAGAV